MHLFPKTKDEWINTILFPFKAHLFIAGAIVILFLMGMTFPRAFLNVSGNFICFGGFADFLAFISAAIILLVRRQYKDALKNFYFVIVAVVVILCVPGFADYKL